MDGAVSERDRGFRLYEPGHTLGPSCDELGPSLGLIRLLEKGDRGFRPRPLDDIEAILRAAFASPVSCASLLPGLRAVARALDEGDMCRGIIATQHLRLPSLSEAAASRALAAERLLKASPDDDKHPGYPKGAADRKGGQFRSKEGSKDGSDGNKPPTKDQPSRQEKLQRRIIRRTIRAGLRRLLNVRRIARLILEAGSNVVPVLDVVGDAAMVDDLAEVAGDFEDLAAETRVAQKFVESGPKTLEELSVSADRKTFASFDDLKKDDITKQLGPAGYGYDYHHIVEQGPQGNEIPQDVLNSTDNIIRMPKLLHEEITSEYMTEVVRGQGSLRNDDVIARSVLGRWHPLHSAPFSIYVGACHEAVCWSGRIAKRDVDVRP